MLPSSSLEIAVFVQSCPQRRESREETLASLRASDVGDRFTLLEHPENIPKCEFFESVLTYMADAPAPYVMRCEDDVLVNRHILHNFLTWPILHDSGFGAGWLYVSAAAFYDGARIGMRNGERFRSTEVMYGSLCVAMPRNHAGQALVLLQDWKREHGCPLDTCECSRWNGKPRPPSYGQDAVLSRAVWGLGKRVYFPKPVLAENRLLPSTHGLQTTGHHSHWKAGKLFDEKWKRP